MSDDLDPLIPPRIQAETPPAAADQNGQNLLEQARRLRQSQSTADIILIDKPSRISRLTYIYLASAVGCLILLIYLFTAASSRKTMGDRLDQISRAAAKTPPTAQSTGPENEHAPEPAVVPATAAGSPYGPFGLPAQPSRPGFPAPPAVHPAPPSGDFPADHPSARPPRTGVAEEPRATAGAAARPAKPAPRAPSGSAAGNAAYTLLLENRPAFAAMLQGGSEELSYQEYTATPKGGSLSVLDFTFRRGSAGEITHYIWEVDTQARSIRPIGLNAARLDRLQLKRGESE